METGRWFRGWDEGEIGLPIIPTVSAADIPSLSLDRVVDYPRPGASGPTQFAFSPGGRLLTFLWSGRGDSARDLWAMEVSSGERSLVLRASDLGASETNLSQEETLRRERQRVRDGGITQYQWAKDAPVLLIPLNGQIFVVRVSLEPAGPQSSRRLLLEGKGAGRAVHVAPSEQAAVDAKLTPAGDRVLFARGGELWVVPLEPEAVPIPLTTGSGEALSNGVAEFIAQEEMGRSSGFWISPDGRWVAYAQVDERHIPEYPIVHQGAGPWRVETHRYPFAGAANAQVRLGVVPLAGGDTRWLDLGEPDDRYLARVDWQNGDRLIAQIEDRAQRRLELRAYDVGSGVGRLVLIEESDVWVNLHSDLRILADGSFLWASEQSGFKHLALHAPDGTRLRQLTAGPWAVDAVVHLDEPRRRVYFTAGRESPVERHLYWVSLDGGDPVLLTEEPGFHAATFAASGDYYVHTWESLGRPTSAELRSVAPGLAGREARTDVSDFPRSQAPIVVHDGGELATVVADLRPPELVDFEGPSGDLLYGALYYPASGQREKLPVVVSVYGGPHAQMVTNTWGMTVDMRAQHLASLGFLVFKLDGRGSARRGLTFESALRGRFGTVEVEDQVAGVTWLVDRGIVDPDRVGIYGWSYGGYLAALSLFKAPGVFKAGVAGAPVADWDGYDTHYTERYLDRPENNPDGYREASLLTHAHQLAGHLLIVHGLVDENVHFRHSARFMSALEQAGKRFDVFLLPEERHGVRPTLENRAVRHLMEGRIADFFVEHLLG